MIRVENASKSFGNNIAVNQVSLQVNRQEIFGLVGPDGAGKTTLMRSICGLIEPDQGEIWLLDHPWREMHKVRSSLGYMPQRFSLYGDLTVKENIDFFGSMYLLDRKTIKQRADEILELTALATFTDRLADNLSGGMKQKLALTCALITRPAILVLDEPTYGVDPIFRKEFWKILYYLNGQGMTIMVSTPYMDEAELCHRVGFMYDGKILVIDSPIELKKAFPHPILAVRAPVNEPDLFKDLPEIIDSSFYGDRYHLVVKDSGEASRAVERHLQARGITGYEVKNIRPSMEDIFVALMGRGAS
ncbi:MAG: ATP-binding cassette domain-containing protein [Chitinophagales bacterium]